MTDKTTDAPTETLSRDPFDRALHDLIGLPNGAHTQPALVQAQDWYKNTTAFMVQSVRWDEGVTVFVTVVNGQGSQRFVLPPAITALIGRQRDALATKVRRAHGKRIAAQRAAAGLQPAFMANPGTGGRRRRKTAKRRTRKGGGR